MTTSKRHLPNGYVSKGDYDSYEPDDNFQPSPRHFDSGPKAFSVKVHVNNDKHEPGKKIWVQSNKVKTLDNFLEECGRKTNPAFGAPRRLYTPGGRTQIRYLDELSENGIYVITGNERFRRHNYKDIQDFRMPRRHRKGYNKIDIRNYVEPVRHPKDEHLRNKSGCCQARASKFRGLRLKVHINKINDCGSRLILVEPRDKDNIIKIADDISTQCHTAPIMKLYRCHSEGGAIQNFEEVWVRKDMNLEKDAPVELNNDDHIIACPMWSTHLEPSIYSMTGKRNFTTASPRAGLENLFDNTSGKGTPHKHNYSLNRNKVLPGIGSKTMSPASNVSGSQKGSGGNYRAPNHRRQQRPAQPDYYDEREEGPYRARNQGHARDAKQEDIRHKEKTTPIPPGTELNKQPSLEQKQNADSGIQTKKKGKKEVKKKGKGKGKVQNVPAQEHPPVLDDEGHMDTVDEDREEMVVEDTDVNGDRDGDVDNVSNDTKAKTPEAVESPHSPPPPENMEDSVDNVRNSQERVGADNGPQRIDEDEEYKSSHRNASPKDPRPATPQSRGEARRKEQREQDEAASKIQAGFRGRKVRKEFNEKKRQNETEREDEMRRQQQEMRESSPKDNSRRDDDYDRQRQDHAATSIQASFRGYQTRKQIRAEKVRDKEKYERENKAATKIQSGFRGHRIRKEYADKRGQMANKVVKDVNDNEKKDDIIDKQVKGESAENNQGSADLVAQQEKAASRIQAGFRGYQVRKSNKKNKGSDKKAEVDKQQYSNNEHEAAAKIQAGFKGYKGRQEYAEKKKQKQRENEAASKIQASFKGFHTRKTIAEKKKAQLPDPSDSNKAKPSDADLDMAAAKIQSHFRGYKTRKEFKTKVIDDGEADSDVDQLPESALAKQLLIRKNQFTEVRKRNTASKIQVCFRALHFRKVFFEKFIERNELPSYTQKMQAAFKGYLVRRQIKVERENQKEFILKTSAATKIQSHFRGYRVRKYKVYPVRQINRLHAAFRAHITRKLNTFNLQDCTGVLAVEKRDTFATIIQSLCRGYMTRQSLRVHAARSPVRSAYSVQGPTKSSPDVTYWQDSNIKMYSDKSLRKAASRIQSAYRMFVVRNGYALVNKKLQMKRERAAVKIQSYFRGHLARKDGASARLDMKEKSDVETQNVCTEENKMKRERAAVKIQSHFRGHLARKDGANARINMKDKSDVEPQNVCKEENKMNRERAAVKIQSHFRGYSVRKNGVVSMLGMKDKSYVENQNVCQETTEMKRERAAVKIQSHFRGYSVRKNGVVSMLGMKDKSYVENQNVCQETTEMKRERAAVKIQSHFRGFLVRNDGAIGRLVEKDKSNDDNQNVCEEELQMKRELAAVKIQSHFRGHLVRKDGYIARLDMKDKSGVKIDEKLDGHGSETDERGNVKDQNQNELDTKHHSNRRLLSGRKGSSKGEHNFQETDMFEESGTGKNVPSSPKTVDTVKRTAVKEFQSFTKDQKTVSDRGPTPISSRPSSGAAKRNHAGRIVSRDDRVKDEYTDVRSECSFGMSVSGKEGTKDSIETLKTVSTFPSKESEKSSDREVEKEGESPREVEDDASELKSIKKNANAVCQMQAAFRAYKMRREVSELLSGGGELMDIQKVDRAISALRKDFKLRSAKVRRLASCQFQTTSPRVKIIRNADDMNHVIKAFSASMIQSAFRSHHSRKTCTVDYDIGIKDINKESSISDISDEEIKMATLINRRRKEAVATIEAAFLSHKIRQTEKKMRVVTLNDPYMKVQPENSKYDIDREKIETKEQKTIQSAFNGHCVRNDIQKERDATQEMAATKLEAAFRGYRTRNCASKALQKSAIAPVNEENPPKAIRYHVRMHSAVVNRRATQLQAAFAGYQTRKVLISLTKLVEEEESSESNISEKQLERMGSLSETDDFKLRHKSIAKLQAIEAERNETHLRNVDNVRSSMQDQKKTNLKPHHIKLPLIQVPTFTISLRPKSGTFLYPKEHHHVEGKSKTQPELFRDKNANKKERLHGIEIFIKRKMAATTIQSYAKAFLIRKTHKEKMSTISDGGFRSVSRKSGRPGSRASASSKDEKTSPNWVKDEIRARTASIKLEAERRKLIVQQIKQKQASVAKDAREPSADHLKIERSTHEDTTITSKALTPILSERFVKESDLKDRENSAAALIQKCYRGYKTRKSLSIQDTETEKGELEVEYEEWKQKRIQAAVAIQSGWRGYTIRKELQKEQEKQETVVQDPFWTTDSPPGMLVINIGRSKSEIERANKKFDECSMIQMVFRASKVRRKMQVKLAVRRNQKTGYVDIVQAAFRGFNRRRERKLNTCANNIHNTVRGFITREKMQERVQLKLKSQHLAATTLQSAYRAYVKKSNNATQKEARRKLDEAHQAAKHIQSAYRGHITRAELGEKKKEMQTEAAAKIMAGLVGHRTRVKTERQKKAAIRIIATYRSYRRRFELRLFKEKLYRKRLASTRIQSTFRSYRKRVERRLYFERKKREKNAATRLQCMYRSYYKRCEMRKFKEQLAMQHHAANVIHSSARGRLARVEYHLLKQLHSRQENASVKIQSVYRGFKDRLSVKQLRRAVEVNSAARDIIDLVMNRTLVYIQQRSSSAERIQATVKGHTTRIKKGFEKVERSKRRYHYASQIQAVVKAEQGRMLNGCMREVSKQNDAATKIQSLFRGYSVRKEMERERSIIAEIEPPFISARTRSGRMLALSLDNVLMKNARSMILFHKKATELQAAFRARRGRQGVHDRMFVKSQIIEMTPRREKSMKLTEEDKAATMVQKIWRGYSDRKAYQMCIAGKRKVWNEYASIIQASVRGYVIRKDERLRRERLECESYEEIVRKRSEAADIISYAYKALKMRREKLALRVEM